MSFYALTLLYMSPVKVSLSDVDEERASTIMTEVFARIFCTVSLPRFLFVFFCTSERCSWGRSQHTFVNYFEYECKRKGMTKCSRRALYPLFIAAWYIRSIEFHVSGDRDISLARIRCESLSERKRNQLIFLGNFVDLSILQTWSDA